MPDVRRTVTQNMEWMDLQVGDIFQVDEINFIVIDRDGNNAVIQQYDHVKEHVFNDDNTNKYEGSDLQKYVLGEYKEQFSKEFIQRIDGDFFILSMEDFKKYPFLNSKFNRIRLDEEGDPTWWWTATPYVGTGNIVRYVNTDGYVISYVAINSYGVAPACRIHLEFMESAPTGAADDVLTEIRDLLTQIAKAVS